VPRRPVPPTPSPFPPPPRRAATAASRQNPFAGNANTTRPRQAAPPPNAEKYAPYARAGAQQWEKAKEEAQSKTDAFRGFQQMKPGQSPTGERFAPPPPPRQPRYTTAPRPMSYAPQSAGAPPSTAPRAQRSWDGSNHGGRFASGTEASPGFPGLSQTQSTRKKQGFTPTTPGGDEPPAPRSSAYATYSRGERPQASTTQSYMPESTTYPSPQMNPQRPSISPLRHARSSSGVEEEWRPSRPGLDRLSTRYVGTGGERTDVGSAGVGRSSSVRNSPIDSRWHEHERNGVHHLYPHDGPHRHRSSSPKLRSPLGRVDSSSSDSETSSDEDLGEQKWAARPKPTPRQTRPQPASSDFGARATLDGQPVSGQFPGTNYVKPPGPRETDSSRYQYRPPPPPRNQQTSQAAFSYVPGNSELRPVAERPVPGLGNEYARPGAAVNGPNMYAPFHFHPQEWSKSLRSCRSKIGKNVPSLKGFPSWAVPSSVLPPKDTPKKHPLDTIREEKREWIETWRSDAFRSAFIGQPRKHRRFADPPSSDSSSGDTVASNPRPQPDFQSASHEDVSKKFSASEWNEKFAGAEDIFMPTSSEAHGKRSPVRPVRSRAKSYSKTQASPVKDSQSDFSTSVNADIREGSTTSDAFVAGKFSAEEWAAKLRYQGTGASNEDERIKPPKRSFNKASGPRNQTTYPKPGSPAAEKGATDTPASDAGEAGTEVNDTNDPMDIDDSFPSSVPSTPSEVKRATTPPQPATARRGQTLGTDTPGLQPSQKAVADVNLDDLSNVAPFKPSDTGLGDLRDLNTTLPFESKASPARPSHTMTNGITFSSLKALNLPKPPEDVIPPLEDVTQEAWTRYTTKMSAYMREWRIFNKKMLDHFQARQAQLDITLMSNWMRALGDGPSGEEISRATPQEPSTSGNQKAGYAAYRQWMEEDMKVREWWNVACERHRQAVIELGRVRDMAKPLAVI
jgi:hypothetical protein